MLLIAALVFVSWLISRKLLTRLVPSESLLAIGIVSVVTLVLFQLGEVS